MIHRFTDLARTSIGKKALMSVSGLFLIGFVLVHLIGNSTLWLDGDGAAFDHYAQALDDKKPFLYLAEIGLLLVFAAHIALAVRVTLENKSARTERYALDRNRGARTFSSATMIVTGLAILVFLVIHLLDFRLRERAPDGLAAMVVRRLSEPAGALIYLVGVVALGIHLAHAFRSALQTLGVNHPRYNPLIVRTGRMLALLLGLGFAAFPVVLLTRSAPSPRVVERSESIDTRESGNATTHAPERTQASTEARR